MKRFSILLALFVLLATETIAQNIFSIETEAGTDCSNEIRVSWAADTLTQACGTSLVLALASDKDWKNARTYQPEQNLRWTGFCGIESDDVNGNAIKEDAVFIKCGVTLSGLKKDTEYKYYVTDGTEKSAEHHFRTAGAKEWSACVISDFHSYPPLPGRLVSAMSMIETVRKYDPIVNWVVSPGDVVAWGGSYSFWKRLFEEQTFSEMMWARVNGNHDNWTKRTVPDRSYDMPNEFFMGTSYFPRNGYEGEMGRSYHFRYGEVMFVMMNTEAMRYKAGFEKARQWLEEVVMQARAGKNAPRYVVVCMHYEWFVGTSGKTSQYGRWHEVFDRLGVDLALAGNNHVYVRTSPLYEDKVTDGSKGTVYVVTSSSDNGRGRPFDGKPMLNSDKIMARWSEGPHTVSAIAMNVNSKRIRLVLLDRDGNEIDSCEVLSKKK